MLFFTAADDQQAAPRQVVHSRTAVCVHACFPLGVYVCVCVFVRMEAHSEVLNRLYIVLSGSLLGLQRSSSPRTQSSLCGTETTNPTCFESFDNVLVFYRSAVTIACQ